MRSYRYIVDSVEDRHVYVHVAIYLLHTLGAEISFCNHLHLYLRTLHAEYPLPIIVPNVRLRQKLLNTQSRASRRDKLSRTCIAVDRVDGRQEAVHLLYGICHEYRLEVVAIFQIRHRYPLRWRIRSSDTEEYSIPMTSREVLVLMIFTTPDNRRRRPAPCRCRYSPR